MNKFEDLTGFIKSNSIFLKTGYFLNGSISEQHFLVLSPQNYILGISIRWDCKMLLDYGVCSMDVSWAHGWSGSLRLSSVLKQILQMLYQLVLTASISLSRSWARHIPQISSNAMPMKITAMMVKLPCNYLSIWDTHHFI